MVTAAWVAYAQGDLAASIALGEQALALARAAGDHPGTAGALQVIGFGEAGLGRVPVPPDRGRFARAAAAFEEELALVREMGDRGASGGPARPRFPGAGPGRRHRCGHAVRGGVAHL